MEKVRGQLTVIRWYEIKTNSGNNSRNSMSYIYQVLINLICTAPGGIIGYTCYVWKWAPSSSLFTEVETQAQRGCLFRVIKSVNEKTRIKPGQPGF